MAYQDSHKKTLEDYPRPSVAVDTAVLTVKDGQLCVVLVGRGKKRGLPGTFLHPGERLADAVLRSLRQKAGIESLSPRQLQVFDDPKRDPRGWVLSVTHVDVVPETALGDSGLHSVAPVAGLSPLEYDHDGIVAEAVDYVRSRYRAAPDPAGLLREPFTIRELHALHEAVAGETLQRDTFRRSVIDQLEPTGEREVGTVGKPAALFVRRDKS